MAQDFGDETGDMLLRALKRAFISAYNYQKHSSKGKEFYEKQGINQGMHPNDARQYAINQMSREHSLIPFGSTTDSAYFAKVCQENGIYITPFTDKQGNGFIQFAKEDRAKIDNIIPSFSQLLTHLHAKDIAESMTVPSLNPEVVKELTEIENLPSLSHLGKEKIPNHTEKLANEVSLALEQATNLKDFREILAKKGIGMATSVKGENLFYEARLSSDGSLLPYEHDKRDWAVTADTLKNKYGVNATHDWIEKKFQTVSDGSFDTRGETADITQGIESHDGMDTNTTTLRVEREQTGTDIAPSMTRKNTEHPYTFSSEVSAMRQAGRQISKERGIDEKITDISDKLSPIR
ncbi:hypothetical protein AB1I62_04060 [Enterococcus sp. AN402]|uniref:hypothetical protein n=1 Tax=Enterococcus sp. AN402 TaxID=3151386 RepID=UPI003458D8F9